MAKAKKNEELTLEQLIPAYYDNKSVADKYKKEAEEQNKKIKALMTADKSLIVEDEKKKDNRVCTIGKYIANYYVQVNKDMDENGLTEFLKRKGYTQALKEVVDMDALEKMLYNGAIKQNDVKEIRKFEIFKDIPKLTVKVIKE